MSVVTVTVKSPTVHRYRNCDDGSKEKSTKRARIDPLKALEPARKKLSLLESQRIISVFDDTIRRSDLVTTFVDVLNNSENYNVAFGNELMALFEMHKQAATGYEEIQRQLDLNIQRNSGLPITANVDVNNDDTSQFNDLKNEDLISKERVPDTIKTSQDSDKSVPPNPVVAIEEGVRKPIITFDDFTRDSSSASKEVVAKRSNDLPVGENGVSGTDAPVSMDQLASASKPSTENILSADNDTDLDFNDGLISDNQDQSSKSAKDDKGENKMYDGKIICGDDGSQQFVQSSQKAIAFHSHDHTVRQLDLVAQQLEQSCKNILRHLVKNPSSISFMISRDVQRLQVNEMFCNKLRELRELIFVKLLTTPVESREQVSYLKDICGRERQNAVTIAKLEAELATVNADKEREVKAKNDTIRKLQSDLHAIERLADENIRCIKHEAEKTEMGEMKNSDSRQQKLQSEISTFQAHLANLAGEHKESELTLRKKKFKVESEVENWIQKYDNDMGERQDELEEVDALYEEEKKQMKELEERFHVLEKEYNEILEERTAERKKKEEAERFYHVLTRCATVIQAFWRSFKVRKMLRSKKKGKGKGK